MAEITDVQTIYEGWANFHVATVRREDGAILSHVVEDHGNAVAVLPYDPVRGIAILVRQMRTPVLFAKADPRTLELPAGRADHGSSEASVRAEALEEAGLRLSNLRLVVSAWTMPGVSTECADLYLAEFSDEDRVSSGGGLAHEDEDIEVVEVPLRDLAAMADAGELRELKAFALLAALRLRRGDLFA
ncbi:NUDIX hydrolase [Aureimonas sp. Leaf454]|uniref:NUDIX domain-containing protein n=1 Tax=Aureimonas sp. Leaf454 TaxID=1736381 RepID=UPI000700E811|nr:NUDIX hydrolase [Aureimonas sp. Leaf454]KQT42958.1 NUDIX hydrolase [Aureimonas sp. Leaf454]